MKKSSVFPISCDEFVLIWPFPPHTLFQILLPVVILVIACDHESEYESLSLEGDLEEKCSK